MTLIIRKCRENGYSSNGFYYGKAGERVTAPDWNPKPICGNGLHGLKEGNGNWDLLDGDDWLVIDADDQIVDIDEEKCKFNTGIIKFRGTAEELANSEFPSLLPLNSESAYYWALDIGNRDIMIDRIVESKFACRWACNIGNKDVMINKITDSKYAYYWAMDIGNRDIMIDRVVESQWAYNWAIAIGDEDVMINRINSYDAFLWAKYICKNDVVKEKVKGSSFVSEWNFHFLNDQIESN